METNSFNLLHFNNLNKSEADILKQNSFQLLEYNIKTLRKEQEIKDNNHNNNKVEIVNKEDEISDNEIQPEINQEFSRSSKNDKSYLESEKEDSKNCSEEIEDHSLNKDIVEVEYINVELEKSKIDDKNSYVSNTSSSETDSKKDDNSHQETSLREIEDHKPRNAISHSLSKSLLKKILRNKDFRQF